MNNTQIKLFYQRIMLQMSEYLKHCLYLLNLLKLIVLLVLIILIMFFIAAGQVTSWSRSSKNTGTSSTWVRHQHKKPSEVRWWGSFVQ